MLVAEDEVLVLRSTAANSSGALAEDQGDLYFTTSVEIETPSVYRALSRYTPGTPTRDTRGCPLGASETTPRGSPRGSSPTSLKRPGGRPRFEPIRSVLPARWSRSKRGVSPVGGVVAYAREWTAAYPRRLLLPLALVPLGGGSPRQGSIFSVGPLSWVRSSHPHSLPPGLYPTEDLLML